MTQKISAIAVIGANFGDEGKGLMTDALVSSWNSGTVIRYNGGAQAGHTVETPEGLSHVFSHFGSGTFAGADTYLSRFFICNPRMFVSEYETLYRKTKGKIGNIYVHKDALITTPWDEIINQFVELGRGSNRHGSVGVGINETMVRSAHPALRLTAGDLKNKTSLSTKIMGISKMWFHSRIKLLSEAGEFSELKDEEKKTLRLYMENSTDNAEKFLSEIEDFLCKVEIVSKGVFKNPDNPVIFEGAQGLLLDMDNGTVPHVTHSKTGVKNIMDICDEEGLSLDEVVFVTRHYMTRHGNGPLPHEGEWSGSFQDTTNVPHAFQGKIRTGLLHWEELIKRVREEEKLLRQWSPGKDIFTSVAITHCDNIQFPYKQLGYYNVKCRKWHSAIREIWPRDFYNEDLLPVSNMYYVLGKTRDKVWSDILTPYKVKLQDTPGLIEIISEGLAEG